MSLLGATLAASLFLGAPAPSATATPLAEHIAAERARNASQPPSPPPSPPRYAPKMTATQVPANVCETCRGQPFIRYRAPDINSPEFAPFLLTLVGHFDQKRQYFATEVAAVDAEIAATNPRHTQKIRQLRAKRSKFRGQANEASEQMVKLLKVLVTTPQFSTSPVLEEALYILVLELDTLGRIPERDDIQQRLRQDYPTSPYRLHLDLLAAHDALARNQLTAARALYEKFLTAPVHELKATAHLGLGWSYLRSEAGEAPRPDLALAAFTRAIETSLVPHPATAPSQQSPPPDPVLASAHAGLVHAFAAAGRPADAAALFTRLADLPQPMVRRSLALLERLALAYFARGQHRESASIYRDLQRLHPGDPQQCVWQTRLLLTTIPLHDRDAQLREALHLGDAWQQYRESGHPQSLRNRCRDDARAALTELTLHWRGLADPRADATCAAYLERFPHEPTICDAPAPR